jgi:hypothetical protein
MVKKLRPSSSLQELSYGDTDNYIGQECEEGATGGSEEINELLSEYINGDPLMECFSVGKVTLPE